MPKVFNAKKLSTNSGIRPTVIKEKANLAKMLLRNRENRSVFNMSPSPTGEW
ncbi:hypothetical protein D3C76_1871010 [compost metagenome]